jgi:hypothetical protein
VADEGIGCGGGSHRDTRRTPSPLWHAGGNMEPIAFTTVSGSTYLVSFPSDGEGIEVTRVSDHAVRWLGDTSEVSFSRHCSSVEFVTGPKGLQAQFTVEDETFVTSPIQEIAQVAT